MYIKRLFEIILKQKLEIYGGVNIVGPKNIGKTLLGEQFSKSQIYLKENKQELEFVKTNNNIALDGEYPRLIDEWQEEPFLWNAVKTRIDKEQKYGLYILTGSSSPEPDVLKLLHSGAGRICELKLRSMSMTEMGISLKRVNFIDVIKGKQVEPSINQFDLKQYSQVIVKGGWPEFFSLPENLALDKMSGYVQSIYKADLKKISFPPDEKRMKRLIASLSRNIGTQVEVNTLKKESQLKSLTTTRKYLKQLNQIYILDELESWNKHIRSSVRLRENPKYYFIDPAIAAAALQLDSTKLLSERDTFGFFFEALVIKELRIYAELLNAEVYFYRDNTQLEIDAIIEFRNGDFCAFEVKLGSDTGIEAGIQSLKRFKNKLEPNRVKDLKSLNVITGGFYCYHKDGVNIIPLANLYFERQK